MIEKSRQEAEKRINDGDTSLNAELVKLRQSLSDYGFEGTVELTLQVTIRDKTYGCEDFVIERRSTTSFRHGLALTL